LIEGNERRGLAFEVAVVAKNWAVSTKAVRSLVSYIDPENARSIALAERLGAKVDTSALADDETDLVYRHPLELISL